jgi:peptidoglycan lytic transglycosylase
VELAQKARIDMQTKLRIVGKLSLTFVAGLLWTSALAAAPAAKAVPAQALKNKVLRGKPKYVGIASWYGKQHQGRKMANGQPFDRRKLTAAAWNIPLGTVVQVVNLKNGNSVNVTITDRGPNARLKRAIDLSEAAAIKLGYIDTGLASVLIIPVPKGQFESSAITARLIEPATDAPLHLEEQAAKAAVESAALVDAPPPQSR